jgi:hypothetical protein
VADVSYKCRQDCPNHFFEPVVDLFWNICHRAHNGAGFWLAIFVDFVDPVELRHLGLAKVVFGQGMFEVCFLGF